MSFVLIVKVRLNRPYAHWVSAFDADREARSAGGVVDVLRHPVVGEQAAVFIVRTASPRLVHDMMYAAELRPAIEASGLIVGSEIITVCQAD